MTEPQPWFQRLGRGADGTRLYCFPFAGGSAAAYYSWLPLLPDGFQLRAARLPGRPERQEPPYVDLSLLVGDLADAVAVEDDGSPFALVGHSMGGVLAYEVACALRARQAPEPELLVVSAASPPQLRHRSRKLSWLSGEDLTAELHRIGGIPDEIMAEPEMVRLFLPTVRGDLRMLERHRFAEHEPLSCRLLVLGGRDDLLTPPGDLVGWRQLSTGGSAVRIYPGGHFYHVAHLTDVIDAIVTTLATVRRSTTTR